MSNVIESGRLFDPDTGKLMSDSDLKSVQFATGGRTVPKEAIDKETDTKYMQVINENTGQQAGAHREHSDGRIDAIVTPPPVTTKSTTKL